ncbi:MAG: single-stranded DNA-binding protein [Acholeplasmatales bacterium]|nr:single-stranded DNA-binding protein [Acholeplasmatales bacterium]
MYNYFMLIGFVSNELEIKETSDGKKFLPVDLVVRRDFKNQDGEYTYDKVRIYLWEWLADLAFANVKKDSKIGIKGRVRPKYEKLESGAYVNVNNLYGEKLIFFDAPDFLNKDTSMELTDDLQV